MDQLQQKQKLKQDLEEFRKNYIKKISHTNVSSDKYHNLGVMGNYFTLAFENFPEFQRQNEEINEMRAQLNQDREEVYYSSGLKIQNILEENGISYNYAYSEGLTSRDFGSEAASISIGDFTYLVPRRLVNGNYVEGASSAVNMLLIEYERLAREDDVRDYINLQIRYNQPDGVFEKLSRGSIKRKMKALEKESLYIGEYLKLKPHVSTIEKVKYSITPAVMAYKDAVKKINRFTQDYGEVEKFIGVLREKSDHVLGLAYARLYKENFEVLRMSGVGAKQKLLDLTTDKVEYYAKNDIERVAKKLDKWLAASSIAAKLHEQWRDGRKQEDGTYTPRWKTVKNLEFISSVKEMETLPDTIRISNGVVEQDIANTKFDDLCIDYQIENFEAACVAHEVSKTTYTKADAGKVGKKIHDEWLKRNPWAKGSDLDVEFEDLIKSEQVKDLIHYEIAQKESGRVEASVLI